MTGREELAQSIEHSRERVRELREGNPTAAELNAADVIEQAADRAAAALDQREQQ